VILLYIAVMTAKLKHSDAFGIVLRVYRLERGLTQEQLSERVDVVRSYICTLESGKKQPNLNMVLRLAAALGTKPGVLVDAMADRMAQY
jgi:transcriptional regulator with XRE-family HTH domain